MPASDPLPIHPGLALPADALTVETSRAGGPGGQNVNKVETRVRIRYALDRCDVLEDAQKARLRERAGARLTTSGEVLIVCDTHRSQRQNLAEARQRLAALVRESLRPPKARRPTKPSRASVRRRLDAKRRQADKKASRAKVTLR